MSIGANLPKYAVIAVLIAGIGAWLWQTVGPGTESGASNVALRIPELSPLAVGGKTVFDSVCAACHGLNAAGTDKGPPLVHDIYNPGHHADEAFFRAVRYGARQHHWPFGDMPPQPQVSDDQVSAIVRYVRELQQANGITRRAHTM